MQLWGFLVFVVLGGKAHLSDGAMSMQALNQTRQFIERICQPKTGVNKEFLNQLNNGDFPKTEDRQLKCYFECLLRIGNMMKDGKISSQNLRRLVRTLLTPELQALVMPTVDKCQGIEEGDACDTAYAFFKCHYETSSPEV